MKNRIMTFLDLRHDAVERLWLTTRSQAIGPREGLDLMLAQYCVPFSLAVSAFRNADDPDVFSDDILTDSAITGLVRASF